MCKLSNTIILSRYFNRPIPPLYGDKMCENYNIYSLKKRNLNENHRRQDVSIKD